MRLHLDQSLIKRIKEIDVNGRMLLHLDQSLIERIKEIDANDRYPKQSKL